MNRDIAEQECKTLSSKFPDVEFYVRDFNAIGVLSGCKGCFISAHKNGTFKTLLNKYDVRDYLKTILKP